MTIYFVSYTGKRIKICVVILLDKVVSTPTTIRGNEPLTDEEDEDEVDATVASKKHQAYATQSLA